MTPDERRINRARDIKPESEHRSKWCPRQTQISPCGMIVKVQCDGS